MERERGKGGSEEGTKKHAWMVVVERQTTEESCVPESRAVGHRSWLATPDRTNVTL